LGERSAIQQALADASPEFVRELFDAAYVKVVPPLVKRSSRRLAAVTANAMRDIHAQAVQRPASLPASALLLTGYVAIFAVCIMTWLHRRSDVPMSQSSAALRGESAHPTIQ
jgi:hypothetical protein